MIWIIDRIEWVVGLGLLGLRVQIMGIGLWVWVLNVGPKVFHLSFNDD